MIERIFIDPSNDDTGYDHESRLKYKKHQYIVSISNSGEISEGWWTFIKHKPDRLTTYYGLVRDLSVTKSPNIPEPEMKSSNGIVCKLGVHDNSQDWSEGIKGSIKGYSSEASLTQDSDGFSAKWQN